MRFLAFVGSNGVAPATKNVDVKRTLIIVGIALALYLMIGFVAAFCKQSRERDKVRQLRESAKCLQIGLVEETAVRIVESAGFSPAKSILEDGSVSYVFARRYPTSTLCIFPYWRVSSQGYLLTVTVYCRDGKVTQIVIDKR